MLSRVAKLYQVPNWDATNSFLLAEWTVEEYRHYDFNLIKMALRNPPKLSAEAWRITPDTIRAWVDFTNLKIEEERLRKESLKKQEVEVKDIGPLAPETEELIKTHLAELASQIAQERRPKFADRLKEEMEKIATEDKERVEGRKNLVAANHQHLEFRAKMEAAKQSRGLNTAPLHELKTFTVEEIRIVARNMEEAQEIYLEVYV